MNRQASSSRWTTIAIGVGLLMTACTPAPVGGRTIGQAAPSGSEGSSACEGGEINFIPITVADDRRVYVEPVAVRAGRAGQLLIVGATNYLFKKEHGGAWMIDQGVNLLGVVMHRDSASTLVRVPQEIGTVGDVRAVQRSDGAWDVVIAEVEPGTFAVRPDSVISLWHGIFDGTEWGSVDRIPLPDTITVHARRISTLLNLSDGFAFGMPVNTPSAFGRTAVVTLTSGTWEITVLPTFSAGNVIVTNAASGGLATFVIQPDWTTRGDRGSLFVYRQNRQWGPQKVMGSDRGALRYASVIADSSFTITAVVERSGGLSAEVWRSSEALAHDATPVALLSRSVARPSWIRLALSAGGSEHWVLAQHADGDGGSEGKVELTVLESRGATVRNIGSVPKSFISGFDVDKADDTTLYVVGGIIDPSEGLPVTVVLRFNLQCAVS